MWDYRENRRFTACAGARTAAMMAAVLPNSSRAIRAEHNTVLAPIRLWARSTGRNTLYPKVTAARNIGCSGMRNAVAALPSNANGLTGRKEETVAILPE